MTQPLIVTQLRAKAAEIESHIEGLSSRLANARSDLIHVMATIRMFDPSPEDAEPAKSYHSSARALTRSELFDRCKAALSAASEPLSTRELARAVIATEGWDNDDRELHLTTAHRIGNMMLRFQRRKVVEAVGKRDRATLWRLA